MGKFDRRIGDLEKAVDGMAKYLQNTAGQPQVPAAPVPEAARPLWIFWDSMVVKLEGVRRVYRSGSSICVEYVEGRSDDLYIGSHPKIAELQKAVAETIDAGEHAARAAFAVVVNFLADPKGSTVLNLWEAVQGLKTDEEIKALEAAEKEKEDAAKREAEELAKDQDPDRELELVKTDTPPEQTQTVETPNV